MSDNQGYLTTHVLDTAKGIPAKAMRIELFRLEGAQRVKLAEMVTNDDGRTDSPILPQSDFTTGAFELLFHAGAYLKSQSSQPFLDMIPIRFGIDDPDSHYHVPLLLSPFSYSTYRGS